MAEWVELLEGGKLPPEFVLTEELLEEMGVSAEDTSAVLATLKNHGVKTWAALVTIEAKAELVEYAGNELVGNALRAYLESYRNKQKPRPAGAKRARLMKPEVRGGPGSFLARITLLRILDWSQPVVDLGEALWGLPGEQTFLIPREVDKAEKIIGHYDPQKLTFEESDHILVAGTKGIGKSCFGLYVISAISQRGRVVIAEIKGIHFLIVSRNAWSNTVAYVHPGARIPETNKAALDDILGSDFTGPGVYVLNDNPLVRDLRHVSHFVDYIDIDGDGNVSDKTVVPMGAVQLVISVKQV